MTVSTEITVDDQRTLADAPGSEHPAAADYDTVSVEGDGGSKQRERVAAFLEAALERPPRWANLGAAAAVARQESAA